MLEGVANVSFRLDIQLNLLSPTQDTARRRESYLGIPPERLVTSPGDGIRRPVAARAHDDCQPRKTVQSISAMSRPTVMNGRRTAAACLLVLCLAVSAILHFATQTYRRDFGGQGIPVGISAPDAALALVLANKIENPSSPELQPAVFVHLGFLRLFNGACARCRAANELVVPYTVAFAIEIRGPPQATLS